MVKNNKVKKKVLLIGGYGFIGTNFYKLFKNKYELGILDARRYPATKINGLWDMGAVIKWDYSLNINDRSKVKSALDEFNPDYIINFAAQTHVDRSIHEDDTFLETNTFGVENILKELVDKNVRLIHLSTDEVYGDTDLNDLYSFEEDDALSPSSPYSASKAAADMVINAYVRTHNVNAVTVRPTNNYGPYQYPEKLIPFLIKRHAEGKTLPIYGDGRNEREWLYVEDCCKAIELVMRKGKKGEIYNIGSGERESNISIVGKLFKTNSGIEFVGDRPGHDRRYAVNSDKLRDLGWSPQTELSEGLQKTKDWYLDRLDIIKKLEANKHIK